MPHIRVTLNPYTRNNPTKAKSLTKKPPQPLEFCIIKDYTGVIKQRHGNSSLIAPKPLAQNPRQKEKRKKKQQAHSRS